MGADSKAFACVRCGGYPLEACAYEGSAVAVCAQCGGLWCEVGHWNRDVLGEPPSKWTANPQEQLVPAPQLQCPHCRTALAALRLPQVEGLELDVCPKCEGAWLDNGEWQKLEAAQSWTRQLPGLDRPTTWGEWFFQMFLRLPIEFNIRPRRTPWMTLLIVLICTVVAIAMLASDDIAEYMVQFAVHGNLSFSPRFLLTLVTHQFLHAGLLHLLGNMYLLYILGDNVEDVLGRARFLLFFLACGAIAAVTQVLATERFGQPLPLLGASGSIAGVIAAYVILFRHSQLTFMFFLWQLKLRAAVWIVLWLLLQVAAVWIDPSGNQTGVAWWAHIGGFAAGVVLILPFRRRLVERHALLFLLDRHKLRRPAEQSM